MKGEKIEEEEIETMYVDNFSRTFDIKREMRWQLERDMGGKSDFFKNENIITCMYFHGLNIPERVIDDLRQKKIAQEVINIVKCREYCNILDLMII